MTEFSINKLGEAMAFAEVGLETIERAREATEAFLGLEETENLVFQLNNFLDDCLNVADQLQIEEKARLKARRTAGKLRSMREIYLDTPESWNEPTEIAEWSGIFLGGAAVHFAVAEGIFESLSEEKLQRASKAVEANMMELIMHIITYLKDFGVEKTNPPQE